MTSGTAVIAIEFEFDLEKTEAALAHLAGKGSPRSSAEKSTILLFLADRQHLLRFGRTITGDKYEARSTGPAPVEIEKLHLAENSPVEGGAEALSESDRVVLDHVAEEYGTMTCAEIRDYSRSLAAYQNAWNGDDNVAYPMRFEDFFAETPDRAPILQELREDRRLRRMFVDSSA